MFETKLVILLIICVTFMVYLGVEGFAQYQSYSERLKTKYGLQGSGSAKKTASDFPSQAAYEAAKLWDEYNTSGSNIKDLYKKMQDGVVTTKDIRALIGTGDKGKTPNKSWLTFYDATDYSIDGPDYVRTASGNYFNKKTGSRLNETTYVDTQYFNEDSRGGRTLVQCRSDDFNCIRNLSYSDSSYQPYQGDASWSAPAPATPAAPAAALPQGGSDAAKPVIDCIVKCLNDFGGNATGDRVRACAVLCAPA